MKKVRRMESQMLLLIFTSLISNCCGKTNIMFDSFTFAQEWPGGKCVPHDKTCFIPKGVNSWTIHGLWPENRTGPFPEKGCNNSWKFDPDELKPIRKQLELRWPNVMINSSDTEFWKHEWLKHGTCAASSPALNSQLKYFNKTLELSYQHDLLRILEGASIVPGNKSYQIKEIHQALESSLHRSVQLVCKGAHFLEAVYICLDKTFTVIDCARDDQCTGQTVIYRQFSSGPRLLPSVIGMLPLIGIFMSSLWHHSFY